MTSKNIPVVCIVPGYCIPNTEQQRSEVKIYIQKIRNVLGTSPCKIIFTGGSTATIPPYEPTEASILQEEWNTLENNQKQEIIIEDQAISTLENILFSKNVLKESLKK